jgi:hypothetical protein
MAIRNRIILLLLLSLSFRAVAQDDLLKEVDAIGPRKKDYTIATFKGTRVVNLQSIETLGKGSLEFRIAHRFGPISSGAKSFYGMDGPATIQFHLDYSISDRLTVGLGRSSYKKMIDAFAKYKWLRQTTDNSMPLTLGFLASANVITDDDYTQTLTGIDRYATFSNRMVYFFQVMAARKFNSKFSLQIAPVVIHYNIVDKLNDKNDMLAVTASARYKFSKRAALTAEYVQRTLKYTPDFDSYHNVLSLGFDIETGGHVFQVFFTNGYMINETAVIPYTDGSWGKGNVMLGFNISRTFSLNKKK